MKYHIPTQVLAFELFSRYYSSYPPPHITLEQGATCIPLYSRFINLEEIDIGRFSETKGLRENFVHHTKLLGVSNLVPPMLLNIDMGRWWPNKAGISFRVLPRCNPTLEQDYGNGLYQSRAFAWNSTPGYTFAVWLTFRDRSNGYITSLSLHAYGLMSDYTDNGQGSWSDVEITIEQSGRVSVWSGGSYFPSSSDLTTYLKAKAYGISPWRNGEAGHNWNSAGRIQEAAFILNKAQYIFGDLDTLLSLTISDIKRYGTQQRNRLVRISPVLSSLEAPKTLFNEEFILEDGVISMDYIQQYFFNYGRQHAFLLACETAPVMSDNNISNVFEITNFIYNVVAGNPLEIPKSLSDLWLAYRYQFSTTKLDIEEAIKFIDRHISTKTWNEGLKCYGEVTYDFKGYSLRFRACVKMAKRELSQIKKIWDSLRTYGLTPDFYAIWDMLPYSFIVDWFVPIGDVLNVIDQSHEYTMEHYDFKKIVYSITYEIQDKNNLSWRVYTRWFEESPPSLSGFYWFPDNDASSKSIQMRCIDALALIVGH